MDRRKRRRGDGSDARGSDLDARDRGLDVWSDSRSVRIASGSAWCRLQCVRFRTDRAGMRSETRWAPPKRRGSVRNGRGMRRNRHGMRRNGRGSSCNACVRVRNRPVRAYDADGTPGSVQPTRSSTSAGRRSLRRPGRQIRRLRWPTASRGDSRRGQGPPGRSRSVREVGWTAGPPPSSE